MSYELGNHVVAQAQIEAEHNRQLDLFDNYKTDNIDFVDVIQRTDESMQWCAKAMAAVYAGDYRAAREYVYKAFDAAANDYAKDEMAKM